MALLLSSTAANNLYLSGANDPPGDPFTISWWINFATLANYTAAGWAKTYQFSQYTYNNVLYCSMSGGNGFYSDTTLSTDTWYHLAYTRTGTTNELFLNGVSDGSLTGTTDTPAYLRLTHATYDGNNSNLSAFKHWSAVLTQAEIQQEMYFHVPQRTANLDRWSHFETPDNVNFRDYSGTGAADWTENGTVTQGNPGPPIQWSRRGASKIFVPSAAPAGGNPKGPMGMPLFGALRGPI